MKIQILSSAIQDLAEGELFYELQGEGLGFYFIDTLSSDIDSLSIYAGVHRQMFGFYRLVSKRFPFAIYYRVSNNVVQVWRVLDCRQNPKRITKALE